MFTNKRGFTLIELLVVVLIIGVLTAIAIPMYQGAVDKSHWSTMLPASKAIKDAQEAFKMTNGEYSDTMEHLDVQISNNDLTFTLNTPNNLSQPNVIKVMSSKLGDKVRLASYLDDSPLFAGQLHCEAKNEGSTPNERGQRLCEKLLGGQELTEADGYTGYLLDQAVDKATCDNVGRVWSNKNTKCFKTEKDRCVANGMPYNDTTQFCGYTSGNNRTLEEGATCQAAHSCNDSTFHADSICDTGGLNHGACLRGTFDGATCVAHGGSCLNGTFINGATCTAVEDSGCYSNTFSSGSQCIGNVFNGCRFSTFEEGTTCIANGMACWNATFHEGSTCIGNGNRGCEGSTFLSGSQCIAITGGCNATYEEGATCIANARGTCTYSIFKDGSRCIANTPGSCDLSTFNGTACCEGEYCPNNVPHC